MAVLIPKGRTDEHEERCRDCRRASVFKMAVAAVVAATFAWCAARWCG